MKKALTGIVCAVMITLAGCSSKSAVSTSSTPGSSSNGTGAGINPVVYTDKDRESVVVTEQYPVVAKTQDMVTAKGQDPVAITGQEPVAAKNQEPVVAGPVIGDIFFDFNSSALNNEAQEQLKQNAAWMQKHPLTTVTIEGHCDERGTDEYNLALGERRAIVAMDYLVTFGINGQRLTIISYGEEQPFDQGHNEEAWSRNRRNHFISK